VFDKDKVTGGDDVGPGEPDSSDSAESAGFEAAISGLPIELPAEAVRRLEEEIADLREKQLRLMAEFDNYRKRTLREREEIGHRSQAALAVRLLDVLDDLDRLVAAPATGGVDTIQQALVLIDRKLRKELDAAGLERIDPTGQVFDPAVAEAVSVIPPPSPESDHTVSATFQAGFRFKGSLIRPARVQVYSSAGHA
jgi:molecular chaperone GrpE